MSVLAYVDGIGVLGPGLAGWPDAAACLTGGAPYAPAATILPTPPVLPPAERRRTGRVVKLALSVALETIAHADLNPADTASVFSSSGGDGHNCHEICVALAQPVREISPTRFSNSVHNAAAGYWSIATGTMAPSNVLCAFDASFAAGLLEALAQVAADRRSVLMIAYDTEYPAPLHAKRPIPHAFAIGLLLSPTRSRATLARVAASLTDAPAETLPDPALERLRAAIPAARGLPLLRRLALRESGSTVLDYLGETRVRVQTDSCR
jgi:hypothetical protein